MFFRLREFIAPGDVRGSAPEAQARRNAAGVVSLPASEGP